MGAVELASFEVDGDNLDSGCDEFGSACWRGIMFSRDTIVHAVEGTEDDAPRLEDKGSNSFLKSKDLSWVLACECR